MSSDELTAAVYRKEYRTIEQMLKGGVDINTLDEDGRTALMHAVLAQDGDAATIRFLIEHGADLNLGDRAQKWTVLHFALRDQHVDAVRELLNAGAHPDSQDSLGNTPLWRAVMNDSPNLEIVRMLLDNGADPNKKNQHRVSPVDTASNMGHEALLTVLTRR